MILTPQKKGGGGGGGPPPPPPLAPPPARSLPGVIKCQDESFARSFKNIFVCTHAIYYHNVQFDC